MDYRRIQGGQKKQPDYIVAYRINGKIDAVDQIIKAAQDWGGEIPIVIIDVDRCLEQQRKELESLLEQYNASKTSERARDILQKVKNNIKSTSCYGLDSNWFKKIRDQLEREVLNVEQGMKMTDSKNEVKLADLEINNEGVSAQERKEGMSEMRKVIQQIKMITAKRGANNIER